MNKIKKRKRIRMVNENIEDFLRYELTDDEKIHLVNIIKTNKIIDLTQYKLIKETDYSHLIISSNILRKRNRELNSIIKYKNKPCN